MKSLLVYSVLRLLAFFVPLAVMLGFFPIFREYWWLAVIFAALIGLSLSLIFLRVPLSDASREIHQRRESRKTSVAAEDAASEDAATEDPTGEQ